MKQFSESVLTVSAYCTISINCTVFLAIFSKSKQFRAIVSIDCMGFSVGPIKPKMVEIRHVGS